MSIFSVLALACGGLFSNGFPVWPPMLTPVARPHCPHSHSGVLAARRAALKRRQQMRHRRYAQKRGGVRKPNRAVRVAGNAGRCA